MIVSHVHRFIFLKTKKTAGTAIEAALSEICGPEDVITPFRQGSEAERRGRGPQNYRICHPMKPNRPLWRRLLRRPERYWHDSVGFYEHMPAWRVRAYLGSEVWNSYYKIAFDRNPWDRQVSFYYYKTKGKVRRPSFDKFMQSGKAYLNNHDIYALNGSLGVDFLGRYENLQADLNDALRNAGVNQRLKIPVVNQTPGKEGCGYRSFYTSQTRALVEEWYAFEIGLLGYEF